MRIEIRDPVKGWPIVFDDDVTLIPPLAGPAWAVGVYADDPPREGTPVTRFIMSKADARRLGAAS